MLTQIVCECTDTPMHAHTHTRIHTLTIWTGASSRIITASIEMRSEHMQTGAKHTLRFISFLIVLDTRNKSTTRL